MYGQDVLQQNLIHQPCHPRLDLLVTQLPLPPIIQSVHVLSLSVHQVQTDDQEQDVEDMRHPRLQIWIPGIPVFEQGQPQAPNTPAVHAEDEDPDEQF